MTSSNRDPFTPNPDEWSEVWFDLPQRQRDWMINYYKLRSVWSYLGHPLELFPRLRNGPITHPEPWVDRHHPVNRKLLEAEDTVKREYGSHWKRWQNYQVEYHIVTDLTEVKI